MADPYHVGFVVPDVAHAMAELTRSVGVQWNAIRDERLGSWSYRIVFSTVAPYVELIEGPPGSPWDASDGARFDHLGWWSGALDETAARLEAHGWPIEFDGRAHGRRFVYHRVEAIGGRIELVDARNQPEFLRMWDPYRSSLAKARPATGAPVLRLHQLAGDEFDRLAHEIAVLAGENALND